MSLLLVKLEDMILACNVADWLDSKQCQTSISSSDDGKALVLYTLRDDIKPQPPLEVKDGRVVIPKGTETAVVAAFLEFFSK
jgi:hypothetical protein